MRHRLRAVIVEGFNPRRPRAPCFFPDGRVAHARNRSVFLRTGRRCSRDRRRRRGGAFFRYGFSGDLSTGGGIGFTGLLHASANEALEILVFSHRHVSPGYTTGNPPAARHGDAKDRRYSSGSVPPFASDSTPAGAESLEVRRGLSPTER